jgi:hypothetical protein
VPGTPDGVPVVALFQKKIFQKGVTIYAGLALRTRLD